MMKLATVVILIILLTGLAVNAQKPNNSFRKTRVNIPKDPEMAMKFLEERVSSKRNRDKVYFSLLLAELHEKKGDFTQAEAIYTTTYELVKAMPKNARAINFRNHTGTVYDAYDKLGYYYIMTGNLKKADLMFSESQAARNTQFPKRSAHRIYPVIGEGSINFRQGEFDKTYAQFAKAQKMLDRATTTSYDFDILSRLFLSELVEICLLQGRYDQALRYIDQLSVATSGIRKLASRLSSRLETCKVFELKARYYLITGDYPKARDYLDRAVEYYPDRMSSSDVQFKILKTQALLNWRLGKISESIHSFLSLVKSYRHHIASNFVAMSDYEKEQFYNTLKSDFNLFNAFAVGLSETENAIVFEEIFNNTLNTKALLLNATNKVKNRIMKSGNAEIIAKMHEWENAKTMLSSLYFDKGAGSRIDSLNARIEVLEKNINRFAGLFIGVDDMPDWKKVRDRLGEGEAAVEILRINTAGKGSLTGYGKNDGLSDSTVYVGLILKPESTRPEVVIIPNGAELENKYLPYYRNNITLHGVDNLTYDQFWGQLKSHLVGATRVYISPDGVFSQINLNTLKNPVTSGYLLDEVQLIYVTNTADLLREPVTYDKTSEAVLVGRPTYSRAVPITRTKELEYGKREVLTEEIESFKRQNFIDLPGTEEEVDMIENTLTKRNINVTLLKGPEAEEARIKDVQSPSILHIATHGFFLDNDASIVNPMIRSGLVLAGVKNASTSNGEDGILTAYEATNLDLEKTSLVTLSACETGLGEVRNGEGVYGLQRAMVVAGASNLIMSLWKVDDLATAALMEAFYNNWNFDHNQDAFRMAQQQLKMKYPDPFYWGAFIMLGK